MCSGYTPQLVRPDRSFHFKPRGLFLDMYRGDECTGWYVLDCTVEKRTGLKVEKVERYVVGKFGQDAMTSYRDEVTALKACEHAYLNANSNASASNRVALINAYMIRKPGGSMSKAQRYSRGAAA